MNIFVMGAGWMLCAVAVVGLFAAAAFSRRYHPAISPANVHLVRRHSRKGGYHEAVREIPRDLKVITDLQTMSHWALGNDPWHEADHPIDAPFVGKRHADNPGRTIVDADWRPALGSTRIALLMTATDHYQVIPLTVVGDDSPTFEFAR